MYITTQYGEGAHVGCLEYWALDFAISDPNNNINWPIVATANGNITTASFNLDAGNFIDISHDDGSGVSHYAHLNTFAFTSGHMEQGQIIGWAGTSGNTNGYIHLHFRINHGCAVTPEPMSGYTGFHAGPVYYSDNAMSGDTSFSFPYGQPSFYGFVRDAYDRNGAYNGPGNTFDPCGGNGSGYCQWVHGWCSGVVQDYVGLYGASVIMQGNSSPYPYAFWVHGAIWNYYASLNGPCSGYGYPFSDEYAWNGNGRRQDFQVGSICWNGSAIVSCVTSTPIIAIDNPPANSSQNQPFPVNGWAIDYASSSGTGVDQVDVWQAPSNAQGNPTGAQTFVGHAAYGGYRPDVGAAYGSQFIYSAYSVTVSGLASGYHIFYVKEHSLISGLWSSPATRLAYLYSSVPVLAIDSPQPGNVPQPFQVNGWAADLASTSGSGIDAVNIFIQPSDQYGNPTGPSQYQTAAIYGYPLPDVRDALVQQGYCNCFLNTGFGYETSVSGLTSGYHVIAIEEHSTISGSWTWWTRVIYII
jgi:hypothetical protein